MFAVLVAASAVAAQACPATDARSELLALHEAARQAHLRGDAAPLAAAIGDKLLFADNGVLRTQTKAEVEQFFTGYFKRVRYREWSDASPPIVAISPDGQPGWRSRSSRNARAPTNQKRARKASRAAGSPRTSAPTAPGG